jgi:DNA-binding MarR family transcriptional regulator
MDDFMVALTDTENGGVFLQMGEIEAPSPQMTRGDQDVIDAVQRVTDRGIGATARAIADDLNKDRSTVQARLKRLVTAGYLAGTPISDAQFPTILYTVVMQ